MASGSANGASKDTQLSYSKIASPALTHNKATFAQRMPERKMEEDGVANQKRTAQPPKAWSTGVNPITQRANAQTNGVAKASTRTPSNVGSVSKNLTDRHNWVWNVAVGSSCTITTNANETFTGILAALQKAKDSNLQQFSFLMVKDRSQEYVGQGAEHAMIFAANDVASIEVAEGQAVSRQTNGASKFRTDVDISGNIASRERNLQRWEAPTGSVSNGSLELESDAGGWDQFKANEKLFGLKTDYNENIYTTTINRNDPGFSLREREAAKLAREIEASTSSNAHIREERGLDDGGLDEETKYSGVARDYQPLASNQPGRYVPPSRRPAGDTFVDPAIISSQIARPKSGNRQPEKSEQKDVESKNETNSSDVKATKSQEPATTKSMTVAEAKSIQPSATANVENELLDSFKQFSALEKIRIQDHKRNKASQDKAVKLNDLKKFSQNFKLCTPVPKDLIPILAKDEAKQKALVEKAQKNADTSKPSDRSSGPLIDPKSQRPLTSARWENEGPMGDKNKLKGVPIPSGQLPSTSQVSRPTPGLSARLQESTRTHKAMAGVPPQLPLQSTHTPVPSTVTSPTKSASMRGPPSATGLKFNVKAMEFKPNPAASTFKPTMSLATTAVGSPRSGSTTRHASPAHITAHLFGDKKTFGLASERRAALSRQAADTIEPKVTQNSGFIAPFKAYPTWGAPPTQVAATDADNVQQDVKHNDAYDKYRNRNAIANTTSPINAAHQYQLPPYLQNGAHPIPQVHAPQQGHMVQVHGHFPPQPHFDDHHMRQSTSNNSAYPSPSPRMHVSNMAYQPVMPSQGQMYGGPVQFIAVQPPPGGRQYSNGPHQMVGMPQSHLMVQQQSQNGYMPQQIAIPYGAAYPGQSPGYPPAQPPNGYPSPGRGAPMMMHQGSHQGHQQQYAPNGQYVQPMFSPQPHGNVRGGFGSPQPVYAQQQQQYQQPHHYPHQPRRTPSSGYGHPHQNHHAAPQVGTTEEDGK